jgi:hypothetical protein
MADIARDLIEIFSDPEVLSHSSRRWLYDPEGQVFYRDPWELELERELGIETDDKDDAPRPAA